MSKNKNEDGKGNGKGNENGQNYNNAIDEKIKISDQFKSKIVKLCNQVQKYEKNNINVESVLRILRLADDANQIIEECGPYLYKYEKQIRDKNDFFLSTDQLEDNEDYKKIKNNNKDEGKFGYQFIHICINFYKSRSNEEKQSLYTSFNDLLNLYLKYLLIDKLNN